MEAIENIEFDSDVVTMTEDNSECYLQMSGSDLENCLNSSMEAVDKEVVGSFFEDGLWSSSADLCQVELETLETPISLVKDNCASEVNDEFTRIETVQVKTVSAEEMADFQSYFFKTVYEAESTGRPVHLRLPKDHQLTQVSICDVLKRVIPEPYNQVIKLTKDDFYQINRAVQVESNPDAKPKRGKKNVTNKVSDLFVSNIAVEQLQTDYSLPEK